MQFDPRIIPSGGAGGTRPLDAKVGKAGALAAGRTCLPRRLWRDGAGLVARCQARPVRIRQRAARVCGNDPSGPDALCASGARRMLVAPCVRGRAVTPAGHTAPLSQFEPTWRTWANRRHGPWRVCPRPQADQPDQYTRTAATNPGPFGPRDGPTGRTRPGASSRRCSWPGQREAPNGEITEHLDDERLFGRLDAGA